ncbi:MAG: AAA family ATPase [Methylobacter sp.]|uniref:AAA family ATPase n=1 Tax=Methylobacter sp. TaxID=2051955 RepID=UPI00258733BE|nr:AAA family ATPase [Methylobacter sp.]MCL7419576.1 AAA family ATPase [Methylobacter sp.]
MATMYKTPGVYIEEIPQFPPSIAPVETAIPAFIGYTEKADLSGESLVNKPTKIESIAEYELLFGGAPSQDVTLILDTNNQFVRAEASAKHYLYDSLRLFYANGGGNCYIVSVGSYSDSLSSSDLESAIDLLEQEDEPTIILAPDVVSDTSGPYEFQKKALAHCNKLMDRVTLCDLTRAVDSTEFESSVAEFREKIGINHLKYGAAYGPWIRANLPRTLLRRNVKLQRDGVGTPVQLSSLTADAELQSLIADLINVENFVNEALTKKNALSGGADKTLDDRLKGLLDAFNAAASNATAAQMQAVLQPITDYMVGIVKEIKLRYDAAPVAANNRFKLKEDIEKYIAGSNMKTALATLANHHKFLNGLGAADKIELVKSGADLDAVAGFLGFTDGATLLTPPPAPPAEVTGAYAAATTANQRGKVAVVPALAAANEAIAFFRFLEATQSNYEKTLTATLLGKQAGKDVFRIDLSRVVSKYIGETEKNLSRLFDKAENKNWILFFDEADALFGKRTDIRDAHDKYANQEVAYLLQRIESYNGLVILATNQRANIDEAFVRRFQTIIHFPMPRPEERYEIWQKTFPPQISIASDIDWQQIAARYELTGANILNVTHYCAVEILAEQSLSLDLKRLEAAILREFVKEGKVV